MHCVLLIASYMPPLFALGLILGIIFPYWHFFLFEMLYNRMNDSILEMLTFWYSFVLGCSLWGLLLWSFFATIFTSPGYSDPEVWSHKPQVINAAELDPTAQNPNVVSELAMNGGLRFCNKCQLFKPDKSHHCSECEHCVLGMDHHCPWVNNCVGERNQKYFTLFICYVPICAIHMVFTVLAATYIVPHGATAHHHHDLTGQPHGIMRYNRQQHTDMLHGLFIFIGAMAAGVVGLVLGGFALFQCYLISEGTSTLENKFGKNKLRTDSDEDLTSPSSPKRSRGWCSCLDPQQLRRRIKAIKVVMGPDWRRWWIPVASCHTNMNASEPSGKPSAHGDIV